MNAENMRLEFLLDHLDTILDEKEEEETADSPVISLGFDSIIDMTSPETIQTSLEKALRSIESAQNPAAQLKFRLGIPRISYLRQIGMKSSDALAVEKILEKIQYMNAEQMKDIDKSYVSENFLFFPRKVLDLRLIENGDRNCAYAITNRSHKYAKSLEKMTLISKQGLTSGMRSALILGDDNKYYKIKGCAESTNRSYHDKSDIFGLLFTKAARLEAETALSMIKKDLSFLTVKPVYMQIVRSSRGKKGDSLKGRKSLVFSYSNPIEELMQRAKYFSQSDSSCSILVFEVKGDTRLDEAIFHLTKNDLQGEKMLVRDELLRYLSFQTGVMRAHLGFAGYSWIPGLSMTDNHIGNFVVYPENGAVRVGIADVVGMSIQKKNDDLAKFLEKDRECVEDLLADLTEKVTFSLPKDLNFRYFSEKLRRDCFDALVTGYVLTLLEYKKKGTDNIFIKEPKRMLLPKKIVMSEKEFREKIDYVLGSE